MTFLALLFTAAQVCPDYESPDVTETAGTPPGIEMSCHWPPDPSCESARLDYIEEQVGFNADGTARFGVIAVCTRVPEAPQPLEPDPQECPKSAPLQVFYDEVSKDFLLSCPLPPEHCAALTLVVTPEGTSPRRATCVQK